MAKTLSQPFTLWILILERLQQVKVNQFVRKNQLILLSKSQLRIKVETTEIPSPKKYVKDDTRDKGQDNVEEAGQAGSRTTTTYEVNPADGTITERVGEPVVVNPTETNCQSCSEGQSSRNPD